MFDKKKVIKGLEKLRKDLGYGLPDKSNVVVEYLNSLTDAIALLKEQKEIKEQEAKTGHWISVNDGDAVTIDNDGSPERACYCSECQKYLIASDEYAVYGRYCPFCGAKMEGTVKWE